MRILKCRMCCGEMELAPGEHGIVRHARCIECGYSGNVTSADEEKNEPEVVVIRKKRDYGDG